jgi:hypothetical protein
LGASEDVVAASVPLFVKPTPVDGLVAPPHCAFTNVAVRPLVPRVTSSPDTTPTRLAGGDGLDRRGRIAVPDLVQSLEADGEQSWESMLAVVEALALDSW